MEVDVIRQLTVRARTEGLDEYQRKIKAVAGAEAEHAAAIERKDRYALGAQRTVDKTLRSLDAEYRAQVQFLSVARGLERAQAQGAVSLDQHNRLLDLARQKYFNLGQANDNLSRSTGRSAMGIQQLGYQLNDVGTQLASGTGLMQTFAQQGGQIYQALTLGTGKASDGLKDFGGAIGRGALSMAAFVRTGPGVVGMIAATAVAAGAAAVSWRMLQTDIQNTLDGLGKASGARLFDVNSAGLQTARTSPLSQRAATQDITEMLGTGRIDLGIAQQATALKPDVAKRLGLSYDEAGKLMTKAFADPAKAGLDFAAMLTHVDARTAQSIKSLQDQGKVLEAQRALMEAIEKAASGAYQKAAPFYEKAWDFVSKIVSSHITNTGQAVDNLFGGGTLEDRAKAAQAEADARRKTLETFRASKIGSPNESGVERELVKQMERAAELAMNFRIEMEAAQVETAAVAADLQTALRSQQVDKVLNRFNPDVQQKRELVDQEKLIREALGDPKILEKLSMTAEEAGLALARVTAASKTFETTQQKLTADYNLNLAAINARTLGDRAIIDAERARLSALRDRQSTDEQNTAATRAYTLAIQTATRTLQDQLRDSQRDLNLIGKFGIQRDLQQLRNERDKELEQNRLTPSGVPRVPLYGQPIPAEAGPITGINADFRQKLQALIDAVGGIRITDGFRTFKDQAELYARKPQLAAPPGRSNHEFGLAADLAFDSPEARAEAHRRAAEFGLRFPMLSQIPGRKYEPWHIEPMDARAMRAGLPAATTAPGSLDPLIRDRFANKEQLLISEREAGPLREANMALDNQIALTAKLGSQIGMTAQQIDKINGVEQLNAQYRRDAIPITAELANKINEYGDRVAAAAEKERQLAQTRKDLGEWNSALAGSTTGFLTDIVHGAKAVDALRNALLRLADKGISMAVEKLFSVGSPGGGLFGSIFGSLFGGAVKSANGNVFGPGGLHAFATGGVVNGPTIFPFKNGTGLMGEAGPEAIMPLRRDADGRLGVSVAGGGPRGGVQMIQPKMTVNVSNYGPSQPEVTQRQADDGSTVWDVLIPAVSDRLAGDMRRGQGPLARATESRANRTNLRG